MLVGLLFTFHFSFAQTNSLEECYTAAAEHYPTASQTNLYQQIADLQSKNLQTAFLPQVQLNGQAVYQSPVVTVPIKIPGVDIPTPNHDQYKVTVDASQLIYDGGLIKKQNEIAQLNSQVQQQQVQVDLYKVRDMVLQAYFNVLLLNQQKEILLLQKSTFDKKLQQVNSGIKFGTVLQSQADIISAQKISIDQSVAEIDANRDAAIQILNLLTGKQFNSNTTFSLPSAFTNDSATLGARPELTLFSLQQKNLSLQSDLSHDKRLPKLSAFGQGGYGRPGYNIFDNTFQPFFTVGLKLNWNILGWNTANHESEIYSLNTQIIQKQQETFVLNTDMQSIQQNADINKYNKLLEYDAQLVTLRKSIAATIENQLENGTATATDYVTEQNNATQAELNLKIHQLQLLQAEMKLKNTRGY
ncbi:transporter [Bacteroidota bacterium]|nr:transporter [Bacteroidota bacterium]